MLSYLLVALVTLASIGSADDGEKVENDQSKDDGFKGLGFSVYEKSGRPIVVYYRDQDSDKRVYCFEFDETFEANDYIDAREGNYTLIEDSEVDLQDLEWEYNTGDGNSSFEFKIANTAEDSGKWTYLAFTFEYIDVDEDLVTEEFALKFSIDIQGYTWDAEEATVDSKFVMAVELKDCTGEYKGERESEDSGSGESLSGSGEDGEDAEDADDDDDDGGDEIDEEDDDDGMKKGQRLIRRLDHEDDHDDDDDGNDEDGDDDDDSGSHDSNSDSAPGISSDDSREFDLERAVFEISGNAVGESGESVNVTLHYNGKHNVLHIVFDYFGSSVFQDPILGIGGSSSAAAGAHPLSVLTGVFCLFVVSLFAM